MAGDDVPPADKSRGARASDPQGGRGATRRVDRNLREGASIDATVAATRSLATAGYSDPWLLWIVAAQAGTSVSSSPRP